MQSMCSLYALDVVNRDPGSDGSAGEGEQETYYPDPASLSGNIATSGEMSGQVHR